MKLDKKFTLEFLDIVKLVFISITLGCGITLLNQMLGFVFIGLTVLYILVETLFRLGVLGNVAKDKTT